MQDNRQRLDKWLWFARFARTRSLALRLIDDGHVRVNGRRITNAGFGLKLGDVLTLALPSRTVAVRLLAFGARRGPYPEARLLYEEIGGSEEGEPLAESGPSG